MRRGRTTRAGSSAVLAWVVILALGGCLAAGDEEAPAVGRLAIDPAGVEELPIPAASVPSPALAPPAEDPAAMQQIAGGTLGGEQGMPAFDMAENEGAPARLE